MPFPVLNKVDFSRTGAYLRPDQYFNPTINPEFHDRVPAHAGRGTMKLETALTIAKNLLTEESLDDVLTYSCRYASGNTNPEILHITKWFYNELPEDKKWLVFFAKVSYVQESPSRHLQYRISLRYPERISYSESITDTWIIGPFLTIVHNQMTGVPELTDVSTESFRSELPSALTRIIPSFDALRSSDVSWGDSMAPGIVGLVFRYAMGAAFFYPEGDQHSFPVVYDWASPRMINEWLTAGYRIGIRLHANGNKITFTCRPAPGDRRTVERVLNYSANVFDYLPYTIKGPKEPAAVLYGVELEANGDYSPKELIAAQKDLFFIMKQDGSIHGAKAQNYELVTVPASLKAHKRLWAEFFEKVDYTKFDTSKDTGNGMHVHIDRKAFKPSHLNRFTWFITNPANEDFILAVSERPTKRNLEEWARMPNHFAHDSKIKAARRAARTNEGLRGAVHFKLNKTVEVRLFKGIVSYATVVKNLEFVDSVFHFTMTTALAQLSLKQYFAWLADTPANKYQLLKAFLAETKTADFLAASEVVDCVWSLRPEHLVAERLNKAPFKISNAHVTYLNKKRRKRTFVLKGGKIECIASSGGLLAKLDKSVQQKQTRGAATFAMTNVFAA